LGRYLYTTKADRELLAKPCDRTFCTAANHRSPIFLAIERRYWSCPPAGDPDSGEYWHFGVLLFFHYWPGFIRDFLPRLESVVDAYRTEQQQQIIAHLREKMTLQQKHFQQQITTLTRLAEQQKDEIKKCRQAQLSNFALTLIYYVLAKTSGMPDPKSNDHTPQLLMQLYGIDPGSIRANLELITGNGRRKSLSDRKRTELVNRFDEAYRFFEEQGFTAGMLLLKDLEVRIVGY